MIRCLIWRALELACRNQDRRRAQVLDLISEED